VWLSTKLASKKKYFNMCKALLLQGFFNALFLFGENKKAF
jgi:hypothetical protein